MNIYLYFIKHDSWNIKNAEIPLKNINFQKFDIFIKQKLEMNREVNTTNYVVTIFVKGNKKGEEECFKII